MIRKLLEIFKVLIFLSTLNNVTVAIDVDCIFETINWGGFGNTYTCKVKSSQISSSSSMLTGFTGTHSDSNDNEHVQGFYLNKNCHHITEVPRNIHQYFPKFIGISILSAGVETLKGDELYNYPNLQGFHLYATNVERIPGNFFSKNPEIKAVSFSGNKIKRIGSNLFEPHQTRLIYFDFLNNVCVNLSTSSAVAVMPIINHIKEFCTDTQEYQNSLSLEEIIYNLRFENENLKKKMTCTGDTSK